MKIERNKTDIGIGPLQLQQVIREQQLITEMEHKLQVDDKLVGECFAEHARTHAHWRTGWKHNAYAKLEDDRRKRRISGIEICRILGGPVMAVRQQKNHW